MARSTNQILTTILAAIAADPVLSSQLNSTSSVAYWRLWAYITAVIQNQEEVLNDQFIAQVENIVNVLPPASGGWIQNSAFLFQYSATSPQVIQFSTASFTPFYPTINPALRIITNCSVSSVSNGTVNIKVAKGPITGIPSPLATTELQAFQQYMNQIKPAGITYFCTSTPADRLFSQFSVTYNGAYSGTIANSLLTAYRSYLANINFGGTIKYIDILLALRQVTGVLDLTCTNMVARPNSTPYGGGNIMVISSTVQNLEYTTAAGYIIDEDTTGDDFLSQLTLISQ